MAVPETVIEVEFTRLLGLAKVLETLAQLYENIFEVSSQGPAHKTEILQNFPLQIICCHYRSCHFSHNMNTK